MEEETINLTQLQNLPDPILLQFLENLDPRSLINVCDQSKRINDFCRYRWKKFFKRDVVSVNPCRAPVNWGKFYKIAMDYIPVYDVNIYIPNFIGDDYVAGGWRDYNKFYTFIGRKNTVENILDLLEKFKLREDLKKTKKRLMHVLESEKMLTSAPSKDITGQPEMTKFYETDFYIPNDDNTGQLTINKIGKGILIRDILTQPSPFKSKTLLYKYDIVTTVSEFKRGEMTNQEKKKSKNVLLGENEVLWRIKRILIDEHNFSKDEAEKFISMNKKELLKPSEINITFETELSPKGNFKKSFQVNILPFGMDFVDRETLERFMAGLCDVTKKIQIKFNNKKETLDIINRGGDLVKYLANESPICPLIGSEIQLVKILGEGEFGEVFLIKSPIFGNKLYAAKKILKTNESIVSDKNVLLKDIAERLSKNYNYESVIKFNGGDPNLLVVKGEKIYIPEFAKFCRVKNTFSVDRHDSSGKTIIPKGSYICGMEYVEYVIGIIAANMYENGTSVNFLDVFMFATCLDDNNFFYGKKLSTHYIFMEKADGILFDVQERLLTDDYQKNLFDSYAVNYDDKETIITILFIQIFHALACLQKYEISHNDLNLANIFIEYVTKETKFNDKRIFGNDHYAYKIGDTTLYLPAIPILAKIGDFGVSGKWSYPIVANTTEIQELTDQDVFFPNWFAPNFDILYLIKDTLSLDQFLDVSFISKIYSWILETDDIGKIERRGEKYFRPYMCHPKLNYLDSPMLKKVTPRNILTNKELVGKFMKKPKGKIITLGSIE
jgi:serine/threonine protein kinase